MLFIINFIRLGISLCSKYCVLILHCLTLDFVLSAALNESACVVLD
jgi:hypothetical protein